jgi:hypothetical protein
VWANTNADADANTNADADANTNADADANTNANANTDTNANTDADTNADANALHASFDGNGGSKPAARWFSFLYRHEWTGNGHCRPRKSGLGLAITGTDQFHECGGKHSAIPAGDLQSGNSNLYPDRSESAG